MYPTHIMGPDLRATIQFMLSPLSVQPTGDVWPNENNFAAFFDFDLSPVLPRFGGHILKRFLAESLVQFDGPIYLEHITDAQRVRLRSGLKFKVFPRTKYPPGKVSNLLVGTGNVAEVLEPKSYYYRADAEVRLALRQEFASTVAQSGRVFEFMFPKLKKSWSGHFDANDRSIGSAKLGNSYLCLHSLHLSQNNPGPGGQPFLLNDVFDVSFDGAAVGTGIVERLLTFNEAIHICDPSN
jgi:hypothetical protein